MAGGQETGKYSLSVEDVHGINLLNVDIDTIIKKLDEAAEPPAALEKQVTNIEKELQRLGKSEAAEGETDRLCRELVRLTETLVLARIRDFFRVYKTKNDEPVIYLDIWPGMEQWEKRNLVKGVVAMVQQYRELFTAGRAILETESKVIGEAVQVLQEVTRITNVNFELR